MKKNSWSILILGLVVLFIGLAIYKSQSKKDVTKLAVYGPEGQVVGDYSFISQTGKTVTPKDFEGKIYVADYFFTTCKSICPVMKVSMKSVYDKFKDNPNVKFLSHTVDPETDSVPQLKSYSDTLNIDNNKWFFVTGNKKELYDAARNYYLLAAEPGDGGPDDFIHTQNFALIDKNKKIRGYYDGTKANDIQKLMADINTLLMEE